MRKVWLPAKAWQRSARINRERRRQPHRDVGISLAVGFSAGTDPLSVSATATMLQCDIPPPTPRLVSRGFRGPVAKFNRACGSSTTSV